MTRPAGPSPYAQFSDITARKVCDAIKRGHSRKAAARAANVSFNSLQVWIREGRRGREPYVTFWRQVCEADHAAEDVAVNCLLSAARDGDAKAALAWLERRRALEWRVSSPSDKRQEDLTQVSLEDLEQALQDAIALKRRSA